MRKKFSVSNMMCTVCSTHVENAVSNLNGINKVEVNLLVGTMIVDFDENVISPSEIINVVTNEGYPTKEYNLSNTLNSNTTKSNKNKLIKIIISSVLMLILMYFSMGHMLNLPLPKIFNNVKYGYLNALIQLIILIPIIGLNFHYYINGFRNLIKLKPNMDSLVSTGSFASFIYGVYVFIMLIIGSINEDINIINKYHHELYFESAGMILVIVSIGKYIENLAKGKTTNAISMLLNLTPKLARLVKDDQIVSINIDEIEVDDILLVKPGDLIPIDGIVIKGISEIDESALTGESIPVVVNENSIVRSGTTNLNGSIYIKATCQSFDSTLQKIIELVEIASNSKAPMAKMVDKVSLFFTPTIILLSIITFIIWILITKNFDFSFSRAISVLVISCPCALGLATPVAIMVGTYKAVKCGFLIKSSESLEKLNKVNTIVFDKTGTITKGKPVVTDVISDNIIKTLEIAYSLEQKSEHPISQSICEYAKNQNIKSFEIDYFENLPGLGLKGSDQHSNLYYCGNKKLVNEDYNESKILELQNQGKTIVYVKENNEVVGLIALRDELKDNIALLMKKLNENNIETIMLTGDNSKAANIIAKECNINTVISEVLPNQKGEVIKSLQNNNKIVAMVGDGINDAIALTTSDVGIAIGTGTDIAIESSDVVLMGNDIVNIIYAIKLSKKVVNTIKMNLFWAFIYNVLFIPVAAGALYYPFNIVLNPMLCAIAMCLSSLCVVLNALRINKFRKE